MQTTPTSAEAERPAQVEPAEPTPEGADAAKPAPAAPAVDPVRVARRASEAERKRNERALKKAAKLADPAARLAVLMEAGIVPAEIDVPIEAARSVGRLAAESDAKQSPPAPQPTPEVPAAPAPEAPAAPASEDAELAKFIEQMDAGQVAELVVGAVDAGAVGILGEPVRLADPEKALLAKLAAPVLKKHASPEKMTPEDALLAGVLLVYAPKALPLIVEKIRARRAAK